MRTTSQSEEELQRRSAELAATERAADRDHRIALALAVGGCLFWLAAGLFLMGWSFATTSDRYARVAFLGGIVVGNAGILWTLARAYIRAEERGDL